MMGGKGLSHGLTLSRSRCWQHLFEPRSQPVVAGDLPPIPPIAARASEIPATSDTVYTFDARYLYALDLALEGNRRRFHDELSLLTSLQGLVNRQTTRLFLFRNDLDTYWFERLRAPGGMLASATFAALPDIESVVSQFRSTVNGGVVWDPAVAATHTVAYTIAGVEGLVVLRFDPTPGTLYDRLITSGIMAVGKWLLSPDGTSKFTGTGTIPETSLVSTGSSKVDAQLWAKVHYLDRGLTNPMYLYAAAMDGYWFALHALMDPSTLASLHLLSALEDRDFFVAKQAFFYDLSPWEDEAPIDDPLQVLGTDYQAWLQVLAGAASRASGTFFAHIGLVSMKYCDLSAIIPALESRHDCVQLEHTRASVVTTFNGFSDFGQAFPGVANTSVYRHHTIVSLTQTAPLVDEGELANRGWLDAHGRVTNRVYLLLTMADYDAIQYLLTYHPVVWDDPNRGGLPLAWGINPNHLSLEQGAVALQNLYATRTGNDYFVGWAGGGVGYLMPNRLVAPRPPSGFATNVDGWLGYATPYYRRLDFGVSSFLFATEPIDPQALDLYATLSPIGNGVMAFAQADARAYPRLVEGVPFVPVIRASTMSGEEIHAQVDPDEIANSPLFYVVTPGLFTTPTAMQALYDKMRADRPDFRYTAVDPHTFFFLARRHLSPPSPPNQAAQSLMQSVPTSVQVGQAFPVSIMMRNTGAVTWTRGGQHGLGSQNPQDNLTWGIGRVELPSEPAGIAPGVEVTFAFTAVAPATPGFYNFQWRMVQEGVAWFGDQTPNVLVTVLQAPESTPPT